MSNCKVFSAKELVTSSLATIWLSKNNFDKQRPIRSGHVSYLAHEMSMGRFMSGTQIHFAHIGELSIDKMLLINGQHTLSAIIKCGIPQELTILHTIVENYQDVCGLYIRHDSHLSRNLHDTFRASSLESITGLNSKEQACTGSACSLILKIFGDFKKQKLSKDDLINMIVNFSRPAKLYFNTIQDCYGGRNLALALRRASSVAMGIITFLYSESQADDFWRVLAHDDGLKHGDPRKLLCNFLTNISPPGGGFSRRIQVNNLHIVRAIANAWNAYMRGQSLVQMRGINSDSPITIVGTPFLGRESDKLSLLELGLQESWLAPKSKSTATTTLLSRRSSRSSTAPTT